MIRGISVSASGLLINQKRLEASTHNAANLTTAERTRLRVDGREVERGGVEARVRIAGEGRRDEVVEDAVEQIDAAQEFKANARAVQTQDELLGVLLDVEV